MQGSTSKRHRNELAPQAASTCAGCPLVSLPDAILRQIVLQIQDQRSLTAMADSCTALRTAVFAHAEALQILVDMGVKHNSSALSAALTSRPPTDSVQLTLGSARHSPDKQPFPEALTRVLSGWGTCAAVKVLRFHGVRKWSPLLSPLIAHHFTNLQALEFTRCALAFYDVLGLLEQCPGVTDLSMPHMLIKGEQSVPEQQLQVLGRLQGLTLDTRWLGADVTSEVVQHVTSLKHLNLRGSKDGEDEEEQCKLPSLVHLTQLESLCLDMGEDEEISWWEGSYAIPQIARRFKHLHTLHIPDYPVFGVHVLDTLLKEAPQLTNLSVKSFVRIHASRADAPCRWRSLRIGEVKDIWHFHNLPLTSVTEELVISEFHVGGGHGEQFDAPYESEDWDYHDNEDSDEYSDEEMEDGSEHEEEDEGDEEGGKDGGEEGDHSSQQGAEGPGPGPAKEEDEVPDQEEESEEQRVHSQFQFIKTVLHTCQVTPVIKDLIVTVQGNGGKDSTWSLVKLLSLAQPLGAFTKQLTINNWRYGRCNWSGADVEAIIDVFKATPITGLKFAYRHIVGPCFWSALTSAVRSITTLESVTFHDVCMNVNDVERLQGMCEALSGRALHVLLRRTMICDSCSRRRPVDIECAACRLNELESSVTLDAEDETQWYH